jgi:hypothetical protein
MFEVLQGMVDGGDWFLIEAGLRSGSWQSWAIALATRAIVEPQIAPSPVAFLNSWWVADHEIITI